MGSFRDIGWLGTYHLPKVSEKSGWKKRVKRVFWCFLRKMSGKSVFPETMFPMGTDHLHGKTANSGCEIKFFAPFRLRCFRKHELWFKASRPRCNSVGFIYVLVLFRLCGYILCSGSFDLHHRVKFYSFVFIHKIFIRVVCVNSEHAPSVLLKYHDFNWRCSFACRQSTSQIIQEER